MLNQKNRFVLFLLLLWGLFYPALQLAARGIESFESLTASGIRYESGSFVGDEGFQWHFDGARSVRANYNYSGTSIGFGTDSLESRHLEGVLTGNSLGRLRFVIGPYFSGGDASDRSVSVWINGVFEGSYWLESMYGFTQVEISGLEYSGPIHLRLEALGPRQFVLDAIEWWPLQETDEPPAIPEPEDPPNEPNPPKEPEPVPQEGYNPWRSDEDFLLLLESLLPKDVGFDPALWQWAYKDGRLDRLQALEIWFQLESVRRLEVLFRAVQLLEGRYPQRLEWSSQSEGIDAFHDYLLNGDLEKLVHLLIAERPFARIRLGNYDIHDPGTYWQLLWLHWSGQAPSAQQLVQMQYRLEELLDGSESVGEALSVFLAAFIARTRVAGYPLVHQQPAAVFEEELMMHMLDQLCDLDSFEHWMGLDVSYRYADLPFQLWARLSHPLFLRGHELGPLGSVLVDDENLWHPVYGWMYWPMSGSNWIHLRTIGWIWMQPQLSGMGFWFWHEQGGWLWTGEEVFPWAISAKQGRPIRLPFSH